MDNIFKLLLSTALLLCCLTASVAGTQPSAGDGSQANPYEIATSDNLVWLAEHVNYGNASACAKLMVNITMSAGALDSEGNPGSGSFTSWTPIGGQNGKDYSGEFNGGAYTISGLYFNDGTRNNAGLFGNAVGNAYIHDLGISDSYFYGYDGDVLTYSNSQLNLQSINSVAYIDANGQAQTAYNVFIISNDSEQVTWSAGWYVVQGTDITLAKGAVCSGAVRLILADGAKLTATGGDNQAGITVSGNGNSLTIYGQAAQSGQLIANGGNNGAGIGGGFEQSGSGITINGGEVTANGGENAAGIGRGNGGHASNINVAASLTVYAANTNLPTNEISHTDNDIEPYIALLRYVIVKNDKSDAKQDAIDAINAAIEGVTNADIIAIATNAINAINAATNVHEINVIKEQTLAAIASAKAVYASVLGDLGTPQTGCAAVKVTKGEKEVILYAPDKVKIIKILANEE